MILKLMSSFPPQQDAALRIEAYIEALSGVPWRWVSKGLARLVKTPQRASSGARVFCPSVPEVLEAVAAVIREARTKANGGVPLDYSVHGGHNLNVIGELSFVRRETQIAIEAGFVYEGAERIEP